LARARPRRELGLERGWQGADVQVAARQKHDDKPFTAADAKCNWDLLQGKTQEKLRINRRKAWYRNLGEVTTKGDDEVAFNPKRPQPYLLVLLASGSRTSTTLPGCYPQYSLDLRH
jgi:ABC-type transport system substrate-binding protein